MTMHWIASSTPTSGNQVTFSSIPQTFTHLQVRVSARGTTTFSDGLTLYMRLNADSGTNYSFHQLFGNGSAAFSTNGVSTNNMDASQIFADAGASANIFGSTITDILDYSSTAKNKTIKTIGGWDGNSTKGRVMIASGAWRNTNAVTTVDCIIDGGWVAGTRLDLYGITSNPIATGA
jgi:hypothetical protein